jgi:hypothetical protein
MSALTFTNEFSCWNEAVLTPSFTSQSNYINLQCTASTQYCLTFPFAFAKFCMSGEIICMRLFVS